MRAEWDVSIRRACGVVEMDTSTYHYKSRRPGQAHLEQRIKEIGIRKVLGASVGAIVTMISKDFLRIVAIAAVISFPVAW